MTDRRDCTVGELRAMLADYPDYWPVVPIVEGTAGVLRDVHVWSAHDGPAVYIGEWPDVPDDNPSEPLRLFTPPP